MAGTREVCKKHGGFFTTGCDVYLIDAFIRNGHRDYLRNHLTPPYVPDFSGTFEVVGFHNFINHFRLSSGGSNKGKQKKS